MVVFREVRVTQDFARYVCSAMRAYRRYFKDLSKASLIGPSFSIALKALRLMLEIVGKCVLLRFYAAGPFTGV